MLFIQNQQNNMSTQTSVANNYVQYNGKNEPKNIMACDLILCSSCSAQVPTSQIENHLRSHLDYKTIPEAPIRGTRKMNLTDMLSEDDTIQIRTRTLFPELQSDQYTKQAPMINDTHTDFDSNINLEFRDNEEDDPAIVSQIKSNQMPEDEIFQKIKKPLIMNHILASSRGIKQIHTYESKGNRNQQFDGTRTLRKKKHYDQDSTEISEYKIEPTIFQSGNKQKSQSQTYRLNCSKLAKTPMKINTKTSKIKQSNDPVPIDSRPHICPCCGGFYCSYCQSDIPPQYRQYQDENGRLVLSKETMEFYQNHVYRQRQGRDCRHTQLDTCIPKEDSSMSTPRHHNR